MGICACNVDSATEYLCSIYLPITAGPLLVSDRKVQGLLGSETLESDFC